MKKRFNLIIFISLILGIIGGIFIPEFMNNVSFFGTIYINLLKFIIVPILFTSIMATIYNIRRKQERILIKTIFTFVGMFIVTYLLTSLIIHLSKFGVGYKFDVVNWSEGIVSLDFAQILVNLFPANIITMIENNAIFSVIVFAFICGLIASKVDNGNKVIEVVDGFKNIFSKLLEYIMYLTPFGVFSLIGTTIATYGMTIIGLGAKYIAMAYLCSIIVLILVMILPVWIICKINPIEYIKKLSKVWVVTLTTCSSIATLPYTIKVCNEDFGVSEKTTDILAPLGCAIHKAGGAISFALLALFCSQLYGVHISVPFYFVMVVSAALINMAAPGIPSGGIVLGATYLSILGLPLIFIGFYSGIYKFLDMAYTTMNVTGNVTSTLLIAKGKEGKIFRI